MDQAIAGGFGYGYQGKVLLRFLESACRRTRYELTFEKGLFCVRKADIAGLLFSARCYETALKFMLKTFYSGLDEENKRRCKK